jgi:molecular chaperone DnaJ
MNQDYYNILGIDKNSSQDEIKKAYRKLSKKYHPDINPNGEKEFKDISEAYDTLGDPEKRQSYDNPGPNFSNMGSSDIFNHFFGRQRNTRRRVKTPDKYLDLKIKLFDSFHGSEKTVNYVSSQTCRDCNGSKGKTINCGMCGGVGTITRQVGNGFISQIVNQQCANCNGSGKLVTENCVYCSGQGKKPVNKEVTFAIPKNTEDGDLLKLAGKGDNTLEGGDGDLIFKIQIERDECFEKNLSDLIYHLDLSAEEFLTYENVILPHPDGELHINLPDHLETNKPLRVKGKGFRGKGQHGDFYVKMNVRRGV